MGDGERWLVWSPSGLEITLHTINGLVRQLLLVRERRVPVKVVCLRDGEVWRSSATSYCAVHETACASARRRRMRHGWKHSRDAHREPLPHVGSFLSAEPEPEPHLLIAAHPRPGSINQ
jgi:hypothetical protein